MNKAPFEIVKKEIDDSHYYWIDGEFVPGVTSILDQSGPVEFGLRNFWMQNTPEDAKTKSNNALLFGSLIHSQIEQLLYGEEIDMNNFVYKDGTHCYETRKAQKHLMSFHNWFHEFNPVINSIKPEQVVGSKKYKYAGTLDLICEKDGELWLIDFKTSAGIYTNYERQVAAYKTAYEEMYGVVVAHTAILRTGTTHKAGYEFKEVSRGFDSFLNVYNTYLDDNDGKIPQPPEVNVYPERLRIIEK